MFLALLPAINLYAEEADKSTLVTKAIEELSNWYYFKETETLDDFLLTDKHVYYARTTNGKSVALVAFPAKDDHGTAYVHFELSEVGPVRLSVGVSVQSATEMGRYFEKTPADWLYEEEE